MNVQYWLYNIPFTKIRLWCMVWGVNKLFQTLPIVADSPCVEYLRISRICQILLAKKNYILIKRWVGKCLAYSQFIEKKRIRIGQFSQLIAHVCSLKITKESKFGEWVTSKLIKQCLANLLKLLSFLFGDIFGSWSYQIVIIISCYLGN